MSYDLSFDKRHATLLALCLGLIAALLVIAGFLLGIRHAEITSPSATSTLAAPTMADAKLPSRDPPAATASASATSKPGDTAASAPAASPTASESSSPAAPTSRASGFTVQFGAFADRAHADNQLKKLKNEGVAATIFTAQDRAGRTWFAVRSGSYASMTLATEAAENLRATTGAVVLVRPASQL